MQINELVSFMRFVYNFKTFFSPIGEYGLRNKREVWRVKFTLAKIRKAARELLTLDEKDARRLFEGLNCDLYLKLSGQWLKY